MTVSGVIGTAVSASVGPGLSFQPQVDQIEQSTDDSYMSIFLCGTSSTEASCEGGEVTAEQKAAIEADLAGQELGPYIEEFSYESRQQAYDRFLVMFEGSSLTEGLRVEQLPESYRVWLVDPHHLEVVAAFFSGRAGVEEVAPDVALMRAAMPDRGTASTSTPSGGRSSTVPMSPSVPTPAPAVTTPVPAAPPDAAGGPPPSSAGAGMGALVAVGLAVTVLGGLVWLVRRAGRPATGKS